MIEYIISIASILVAISFYMSIRKANLKGGYKKPQKVHSQNTVEKGDVFLHDTSNN